MSDPSREPKCSWFDRQFESSLLDSVLIEQATQANPEVRAASDRDHLESCSTCASRLERTHQVATALRKPPEFPAELQSEAFLEGIFDRAAAATDVAPPVRAALANGSTERIPAALQSPEFLDGVFERALERSIGGGDVAAVQRRELLSSGLGPVNLPESAAVDVDACLARSLQSLENSPIATVLREQLPAVRTPGWLWLQVRSSADRVRKTARWQRVGAAAAAILIGSLALHWALGRNIDEVHVVFYNDNSLVTPEFAPFARPVR